MAKADINHPINVTKDTHLEAVTDVSEQFLIIFVAGLVLNAFQAVWSLVACFLSQSKQACNYAMQTVLFVITIIYLASVTYVRFSHEGRVCSGDHLFYSVSLETRESGVLGIEGQFLTIFICAGWVQCAALLIVMFTQCCASPGKYSPDKERDL